MAGGRVVIRGEELQTILLFTRVTQTSARDCITLETKYVFIVEENQAGFAIGKGGVNVKILEQKLGKKIRIIEHSKDPVQFIKNVVYPHRIADVTIENGVYTIIPVDHQTRGMLIGRSAQNLREYEKIIQRYHDVKELKVGGQ